MTIRCRILRITSVSIWRNITGCPGCLHGREDGGCLASGTRRLTYDTLSDGTKDTIALAFRLAMLEHLFPEGNGLAVFDDPFTDMDPGRVRQACRLVQKFAERNLVIFTTCDNKYEEIFGNGPVNVVHIGAD